MHYGTFPVLIGTPAQLKDELHKLGLDSVEVIETTGTDHHVARKRLARTSDKGIILYCNPN